jgi:hypothetical protein
MPPRRLESAAALSLAHEHAASTLSAFCPFAGLLRESFFPTMVLLGRYAAISARTCAAAEAANALRS